MLTVEKKGKKDVFLGRVGPEVQAGVSIPGRDGQHSFLSAPAFRIVVAPGSFVLSSTLTIARDAAFGDGRGGT